MAIPVAAGAALSKVRSAFALASALRGSPSPIKKGRGGSCCLASCAGCGACSVIAGVLALSLGSVLLAATASLAGVGGARACAADAPNECAALSGAIVGAPMNCPTLSVSQGYGDTPWEHPHTGIDIVCPPGTMVIAVGAGVFHHEQGGQIACSYPKGSSGGLGTYGLLDVGHMAFLYGHLDGFVAPDGTQVTIGQPLGFEGATGCATGDHLHFEVLESGTPVDPCPLLPAGYPDPHDVTGLRCWGSAPP
jgi:murein DD-endopeptidase MepM/ murein hydrolase activator NlpD